MLPWCRRRGAAWGRLRLGSAALWGCGCDPRALLAKLQGHLAQIPPGRLGGDLPAGDRLPAGEGPAPCTRGPDSWAYIVLQNQRVEYKTSIKTLLGPVEGENKNQWGNQSLLCQASHLQGVRDKAAEAKSSAKR